LISFLVAMDQKRTIGKDNDLPWHLPADLKYFKQVTMGHPIVMGRKTHEAIGRVLPGRENIVLTREKSYTSPGCTVIHSIEDLLNIDKEKDEEVFVIGGAEIFKEVFTSADRLYITLIEDVFEGDTYFPDFDQSEWEVVSKEKGIKDEKNPYDYYYIVFKRR
jgi:dihydrofolate reductase